MIIICRDKIYNRIKKIVKMNINNKTIQEELAGSKINTYNYNLEFYPGEIENDSN